MAIRPGAPLCSAEVTVRLDPKQDGVRRIVGRSRPEEPYFATNEVRDPPGGAGTGP